jgi:catechol O-methyltransferase
VNPEGSGVRVYGFELHPDLAAIARDMVRLAGLDDVVTVLDGPGADSLRRLVAEGVVTPGAVDAVFLDHWEQLYVPDLQVCEELGVLREGAVIMADNTDMPGAPDYLKYVKGGGSGRPGAPRYESKSLEVVAEDGSPVRGPVSYNKHSPSLAQVFVRRVTNGNASENPRSDNSRADLRCLSELWSHQ